MTTKLGIAITKSATYFHPYELARIFSSLDHITKGRVAWNIQVDEAMFLGGLEKADFLREFEPDFFFDDQTGTCDTAAKVSPTGHVVSGVKNEPGPAPTSGRPSGDLRG